MDLVAEYAARYGGPPDRRRPWHEFMGLVSRVGRFEARDVLQARTAGILAQSEDLMAAALTAELRQQAAIG